MHLSNTISILLASVLIIGGLFAFNHKKPAIPPLNQLNLSNLTHYLDKIGWTLEGKGEKFEIISNFRKKTGIYYINSHNPRIEINEKDIYLAIPAKECEIEMIDYNSVTIHVNLKVYLKFYNYTEKHKKNYGNQ